MSTGDGMRLRAERGRAPESAGPKRAGPGRGRGQEQIGLEELEEVLSDPKKRAEGKYIVAFE